MTLYAAYGTNLDPARMGERCPHSPLATTGWLQGWRLTFGGEEHGWDGALSTIVEDPIDQVFVAVYDITREDEAALDGWEAADLGLYRKTKVRVATLTGEIVVWTYVLDAYEGGLPSASYLGVLADAAEAADAPADYVANLRRRPCRSTVHSAGAGFPGRPGKLHADRGCNGRQVPGSPVRCAVRLRSPSGRARTEPSRQSGQDARDRTSRGGCSATR